jgi:hypothetical protein
MNAFDIIAFDADDTLWDYERLYAKTPDKIAKLLLMESLVFMN